jgi:hypothetical protein
MIREYQFSKWSKYRISVLLTILSLMMWSFSITQINLSFGYFGFIQSLPFTFYLSFLLLTLSSFMLWISKERHDQLLLLQLFFLVVSLWLIPALFYSSSGNITNIGRTGYVVLQGHTAPNLDWYFSWPGFFFLTASLAEVIGGSLPYWVANIAPFIMMCLYILCIYPFFSNVFDDEHRNYRWAALWVFTLVMSGLTFVYGFGPPALAYVAFILVLTSITQEFRQGEPSYNTIGLPRTIVLVILPVIHFLTSLAALSLVISGRLFKNDKRWIFIVLSIICISAWAIYGAVTWFDNSLSSFIENAFRLDTYFRQALVGRIGGGVHSDISMIRISRVILLLIIASLGVLLSFRYKKKLKSDKALLISTASLGVLGFIMGAGYGVEGPMRFVLFLIPILVYFSVKSLSRPVGSLILCLFLIMSIPLFYITQYGEGETVNYVPGYRSSLSFFQNYTDGGDVLTFNRNEWGGMGDLKSYSRINLISYGPTEPLKSPTIEGISTILFQPIENKRVRYVPISYLDQSYFSWSYGDNEFIGKLTKLISDSHSYNLIYSMKDQENKEVLLFGMD